MSVVETVRVVAAVYNKRLIVCGESAPREVQLSQPLR